MADRRDILIRLLGEETVAKMADRAGDGLDRFGDKLDATEKDAKGLDRQIAEVEGNLKQLAVAFARTTDAADRVDITKAIRRQQTELRRLTKAKDLLPDFSEAGHQGAMSAAAGFAKQFPAALRGAMAGGPGAVVGGAAATFLVPAISAAVQGAVVGGVGIGGVIGGIALAARDSRVQAAGQDLADTVMGDLEESGARFVQPTISGIGIIRDAWEDVSDDVDDVFAATARYVEPLARGVGDFVREITPGIREAAEAAGPIIREIGEGLPRIGRALGDLFSDFADDADEGASAVRWLFMVVEDGIRFVGGAIHAFAQLYRTVLDVADAGATLSETLFGWVPGLGDSIAEGRRKVDELKGALDKGGVAGEQAGQQIAGGLWDAGDAADKSAVKIRTWADVVGDATSAALSSEHATIRLEEAIDRAAEAAREGANKGIDPNTEAGRRNRLALLGIAEAANAAAEDIYENTNSHEAARAATERGRKKFLEAADAMGVEKGQAIALANKLFAIPNINRTVTVNNQQALSAISAVQQSLGKVKDKRVGVYYTVKGDLKLPGGTQLKGLSSGGPVTGPGPKGVDSQVRMLAPGEHVLTAAEVDAAGGHAGVERLRAAIRSGGSGGGTAGPVGAVGGGTQRVEVVLRWADDMPPGFGAELIRFLRVQIKNNGGSVQSYLGREA